MITVRSFDVFDTCLIRKVATPSCVFYEAAKKIFARLGIPSGSPLIEDFVATRVNAERIAREQSSREDVGLDEIWGNVARLMGWQYDESLLKCELDAEEELLEPVSSIREQVRVSRQQGCRIVFVSDMYLPKVFIERQLIKHGFARAEDGFYVSGEIGKTKASGNLFKHLLAQEKVAASSVFHTGDNQQSDYAFPSKLGIRAQLFSDVQLSHSEIGILRTSNDSIAATRIAGAMRAFRLGCESGEKREINELASQFAAPFVMGFATWVLQRAQENGVKRLYFLSRDCQLVWKVARELAPQFGDIDCRYLYVSRQALYLPSANAISPEGMPWMKRPFEDAVLKNLLAKIELKFEDVQSVLGELAGNERERFRLKSQEDWRRFWEGLNQEPIRGRINKLIDSRRETARLYFESEGLFDADVWAIVDLGWYLTGQQSLLKILNVFGWKKQIQGFYLALRQGRIGRASAGDSEALIYQPPSDFPIDPNESSVFSCQTLLEHIVGCADHPTVHHYEIDGGKVNPMFANPVNEATSNFCQKLHSEVLEFIVKNNTLVEDFKEPVFCRESLASVTKSFFQYPTEKMVKTLAGLSIAADQNGLDSQLIVQPLTVGTVLQLKLPQWFPFNQVSKAKVCHWPEGAMAITPKSTKLIASMVQGLFEFIDNWKSKWHSLTMRIAFRTRLRRFIQGS